MKTTEQDCNTTEESCSTNKTSKLTTVKTVYARAAVVLLALNFCLTGYVVFNMNQTTQAQIDGITGATGEITTKQQTVTAAATTQQTPQTTEVEASAGEGTTSAPVTTREK